MSENNYIVEKISKKFNDLTSIKVSELNICIFHKELWENNKKIKIKELLIRKDKVLAALRWLKVNNDLYKDIKINEENINTKDFKGNEKHLNENDIVFIN